MTQHTCTVTGKSMETKTARLPRGWKRIGDAIYSPEAVKSIYSLRAVSLPVVQPVDCEWSELRDALREAWGQCTACANWMLSQLWAAEPVRHGQPRMPKPPRVYLYPGACLQFPELPSQVVATIENAIQAKYRATRYATVWTCEQSLPNYRYPMPLPLPKQNVRLGRNEAGDPCVTVTLLRGKRITLKLRRGAEWRRQLADFERLLSGDAELGECAIYRVTARASDGRNGDTKQSRVMFKLVGRFPRKSRTVGEKQRWLRLRTDRDCLWYGVAEDRELPYVVNADQVQDWSHQHARWLHRVSEDTKYETRQPKRRGTRRRRDYAERAKKYRDRMDSFIKTTVAHLRTFCDRNRITCIAYDDREIGYIGSFPWFALRHRLATVCNEAGIVFEHASGEVKAKSQESLAENRNGETE